MNRLTIVGIGFKPLSPRAVEVLTSANAVVAPRRVFEVFRNYPEFSQTRERIRQIDGVGETIRFIRERLAEGTGGVVLLASGDPLFFGIGRRALFEFGQGAVEIIPDVSSMQAAFSRIGEPWERALLVSLHAGPDPEKRKDLEYELADLPDLLDKHDTIGILTDKENNPAVIAALLASTGRPSSLLFHVCQRLGYEDEAVATGCPEEVARMSFGEPNVVIIKRREECPVSGLQRSTRHGSNPAEDTSRSYVQGIGTCGTASPRFGLREGEIAHSRGLITKDEVRAVTIHKLRLPDKGVLWDIGAGSGALSLEAARLYPGLMVFAIEKDVEQLELIRQNRSAFVVPNLTVVPGDAPGALSSLPGPDRVFVGGSDGELEGILELVRGRMNSGIVVINAVTIETLNEALQGLDKCGFRTGVAQISVSRSKPIGNRHHLAALNPVFIISGERS